MFSLNLILRPHKFYLCAMKKFLLLLSVLFVVSCSSDTEELAPVIKYALTTSVNPSTVGTIEF